MSGRQFTAIFTLNTIFGVTFLGIIAYGTRHKTDNDSAHVLYMASQADAQQRTATVLERAEQRNACVIHP